MPNIYSPPQKKSHTEQTIAPPNKKSNTLHHIAILVPPDELIMKTYMQVRWVIFETHYNTDNIKNQDYWLLTSNVGIKIQKALSCSTGLKKHILGISNLQNGTKWKPYSVIHHQIPSHGYLLTEGPQLTFMKLFYKHVRIHDQARGQREISKNTEWNRYKHT